MFDPYATHIPVLAAVLAAAGPGPVVEYGAGNFSTPLLHAVCAATARQLVTLESDSGWLARFTEFHSAGHRIELVTDWAAVRHPDRYAVVFIDHAPAEQRKVDIDKLREYCDFMVVHDTEDIRYAYEASFTKFKYRRDYKRVVPWTTVLSMTHDLSAFSDL